MRLNLKKIGFRLPEKPFGRNNEKLSELVSDLKIITKGAGTNNDKFRLAWNKLIQTIQGRKNIEQALDNKIDIRALGGSSTLSYGT